VACFHEVAWGNIAQGQAPKAEGDKKSYSHIFLHNYICADRQLTSRQVRVIITIYRHSQMPGRNALPWRTENGAAAAAVHAVTDLHITTRGDNSILPTGLTINKRRH